MNRSLLLLKEIYKPYKYTIRGHAHILNSTSGDYVVKEKKQDIKKLYTYLESRNISCFPPLIDDTREGVNVFSYVSDTPMPKEQRANDLIKTIATIHSKTSYEKEVTEDDYKKIYEHIKEQIDYLRYYYDKTFDDFFEEIYPSPSHYLLLINISKILASFDFASHELEEWYKKVVNLKQFRVSLIHNKLALEHFFKSDKDYLISWEDSRIDSPILDLVSFYQKEYLDLPFNTLLANYLKINPLKEEEMSLFFTVIAIPFKVTFDDNEMNNFKEVNKVLDYVYKTEELIRPYYTSKKE